MLCASWQQAIILGQFHQENDLCQVLYFEPRCGLMCDSQTCVCRSGRTGRAGKTGTTIAMVTAREMGYFKRILKQIEVSTMSHSGFI